MAYGGGALWAVARVWAGRLMARQQASAVRELALAELDPGRGEPHGRAEAELVEDLERQRQQPRGDVGRRGLVAERVAAAPWRPRARAAL